MDAIPKIALSVHGFGTIRCVRVVWGTEREIVFRDKSDSPLPVLVTFAPVDGRPTMTVASCVEIRNETHFPIYMKAHTLDFEETLEVPVKPSCCALLPLRWFNADISYRVSNSSDEWCVVVERGKKSKSQTQCCDGYYFRIHQLDNATRTRKTIIFLPPVLVQNLLPRMISFELGQKAQGQRAIASLLSTSAKPGAHAAIHIIDAKAANALHFVIKVNGAGFKHGKWVPLYFPKDADSDKERDTIAYRMHDAIGAPLNVTIRKQMDSDSGVLHLQISCPMWIVNRTELEVKIGSDRLDVDAVTRMVSSDSDALIAPVAGQLHPVVVETWENQRKYPIKGWSSTLLPTERPSWSDKGGIESTSRPPDSFSLPQSWAWTSEWQHGPWEYAATFASSAWGKKGGFLDGVRRRRWWRTREINREQEVESDFKLPIMFAPSDPLQDEAQSLRLGLATLPFWSEAVSLVGTGSHRIARIPRSKSEVCEVVVNVSRPNAIANSLVDGLVFRVADILPRFCVANEDKVRCLRFRTMYDPSDGSKDIIIEPGKRRNVHTWPRGKNARMFRVCYIDDADSVPSPTSGSWSCLVPLSYVGTFPVRAGKSIVRVESSKAADLGVINVSISLECENNYTYDISNLLPEGYSVVVAQKQHAGAEPYPPCTVGPGDKLPFGWSRLPRARLSLDSKELPYSTVECTIMRNGKKLGMIEFDMQSISKPLKVDLTVDELQFVRVHFAFVGSTRSIQIFPNSSTHSPSIAFANASSSVSVHFQLIDVALIDDSGTRSQEIANMRLTDVKWVRADISQKVSDEFEVGDFRVDNQLPGATYEVAIHRTPASFQAVSAPSSSLPRSIFRACIIRNKSAPRKTQATSM